MLVISDQEVSDPVPLVRESLLASGWTRLGPGLDIAERTNCPRKLEKAAAIHTKFSTTGLAGSLVASWQCWWVALATSTNNFIRFELQ